jgi:hypothetical protein
MLFSGHPSTEDRRCACGGLARPSLALADDSRRPRASCDPAFDVPSSALPSSPHLPHLSHILVSCYQVDVVDSLHPVSRSSNPRSRLDHSADGVEQRIQGSEDCVQELGGRTAQWFRCKHLFKRRVDLLSFELWLRLFGCFDFRLSTPPDRWASATR